MRNNSFPLSNQYYSNDRFSTGQTFHSYLDTNNSSNEKTDRQVKQKNNLSSRISYQSNPCSRLKMSKIKRLNQLPPKTQIIMNSRLSSKSFNQTQPTYPQPNSVVKKSSQLIQLKPKNVQFKEIKPSFNLINLCGLEEHQGKNGCVCSQPCKWRHQWLKAKSIKQQTNQLRLYKQLQLKRPSNCIMKQINLDSSRTFPQCQTYRNRHYQSMLEQMLKLYAVYDPQVGYVQGMNLIMGVILYHVKDYSAFWVFVDLMEEKQLRMLYTERMIHTKAHVGNIQHIMRNYTCGLYKLIEGLGVALQTFVPGWLLSLMGSIVPILYLAEIISGFKQKGFNYIYRLIIAYLLFLKTAISHCQDEGEVLELLRGQNAKEYGAQWKVMIQSAHKSQLFF